MNKNNFRKLTGFTIVEMLIVMVIISILASIILMFYTGASRKADIASLQSDLVSASKRLKLFEVESNVYPTTIDCSTPNNATNYCLQHDSGTTFSYTPNNTTYPATFVLDATKNGITYRITENSAPVELVASALAWNSVSSGATWNCGIASNNNLYCWGNNSGGHYGDGTVTQSLVPVPTMTSGVLNGLTIKQNASGSAHECVIASDDNAYCWGRNTNGRVGDNSLTQRLSPVAVWTGNYLNGLTVKVISTGVNHTCAIASDNNAYCWGLNTNGQLGNNSTTLSQMPVPVDTTGVLSGKTITAISAGGSHTCAVTSEDKVYCWGLNTNGQLGDGTNTQSLVPVKVVDTGALGNIHIKSVSSASMHTCALSDVGLAYCWGSNTNGLLGDGNSSGGSNVPISVNTSGALSGKVIRSLDTGAFHTCVNTSDNSVFCWGQDVNGEVGNGATANAVPLATSPDLSGVLAGKSLISVSGGNNHTCAVASDGSAYCWGLNTNGQLGNNSTTTSLVPVIVSSFH